jgi:transcriptional regulator with XRE-family HTH domain
MPSLGNDLALIRKKLNLTLEDIQDATKIPPHILSSIEDDSIFSKLEENKTYIRSYIRSYAKALKIKEELIVEALDQQESGNYKGLLGNKYQPESRTAFELDDDEEEGEDTASVPVDEMVHDHSPEFSEKSEQTAPPEEDSTVQNVNPPPSIGSVDWAAMGRRFQPLRDRPKYWGGILILVFAVLAAILAFYYYQTANPTVSQNDPVQNQTSTDPGVIPDSLQLDVATPQSEDSLEISNAVPTAGSMESMGRALESLPDTLLELNSLDPHQSGSLTDDTWPSPLLSTGTLSFSGHTTCHFSKSQHVTSITSTGYPSQLALIGHRLLHI